eukprot:GHVU01128047.1.p1 GENE.GHVU01128047.1~~GHVU01128047.1.p1  ORF type:complete len:128 (+),score=10.34 GHVU01128047.1:147-530(+)
MFDESAYSYSTPVGTTMHNANARFPQGQRSTLSAYCTSAHLYIYVHVCIYIHVYSRHILDTPPWLFGHEQYHSCAYIHTYVNESREMIGCLPAGLPGSDELSDLRNLKDLNEDPLAEIDETLARRQE